MIWLVTTLASIDGPMIGYIIAIVIFMIGYFEPRSGVIYTDEWHFWLGIAFAISFTALSITYQIAFLPGIRIWFNIQRGKVEEVIDENGNTVFVEESSSIESRFEEPEIITFTRNAEENPWFF